MSWNKTLMKYLNKKVRINLKDGTKITGILRNFSKNLIEMGMLIPKNEVSSIRVYSETGTIQSCETETGKILKLI